MDPELFEVLREVRLRLARARGVPPYVIFHDTTLREMADRRPSTLDDLHEIYGVGARKAADFGDAFLDAIRTFRNEDGEWGHMGLGSVLFVVNVMEPGVGITLPAASGAPPVPLACGASLQLMRLSLDRPKDEIFKPKSALHPAVRS